MQGGAVDGAVNSRYLLLAEEVIAKHRKEAGSENQRKKYPGLDWLIFQYKIG
jgi:hypothetical protein